MINNQYNIQLDKLCSALNLGTVIKEPLPIPGGHLHKMYCVQTTNGKYAVKAINPNIIIRPAAKKNYIDSENIAQIASRHIPTVCAKRFENQALQVMENQYYLIFDWLDGNTLKNNEITINQCSKIGETLAKIHSIDFSMLDIESKEYDDPLIDWQHYLKKGKENNASPHKKNRNLNAGKSGRTLKKGLEKNKIKIKVNKKPKIKARKEDLRFLIS